MDNVEEFVIDGFTFRETIYLISHKIEVYHDGAWISLGTYTRKERVDKAIMNFIHSHA
jgi:hypothetical protein